MYTRRTILQNGAAFAALTMVPKPLLATLRQRPEPVPPIEDPDIQRLTDAAMNTARSAGATYADIRLTHTYKRYFGTTFPIGSNPMEAEEMTIGVRALIDGYWGFASSPVWTLDEAARLAKSAIRNAKANTLGHPRTLELAPVDPAPNGHWTTPIKDDPFLISREEIDDFLGGIYNFIAKLGPILSYGDPAATFVKQDKAFASTFGQYYTQRLYQTAGHIGFGVGNEAGQDKDVEIDTILPAAAGFEYLRDQPLYDLIQAGYDEAVEDLRLPLKPVDVGRYNVIFDAGTTARLVSQTIGAATEMDRALGHEANAAGTSYITDLNEMMGTLKIGNSKVTVLGNRSEPQGAATVKWDDEGVMPKDFTLVKDGILTDMQTNREGAAWLKDYYTSRQQPIASNGCMYASEAVYAPLTHCSNLQLQPSRDNETFDSLIAGEENGIAIKDGLPLMDFQQMTGFCGGFAYEIKHGKRTAQLANVGVLFRTPELWKSITALGGISSQRRLGMVAAKGQPLQVSYHSVTAVPFAAKELTVIDSHRKA